MSFENRDERTGSRRSIYSPPAHGKVKLWHRISQCTRPPPSSWNCGVGFMTPCSFPKVSARPSDIVHPRPLRGTSESRAGSVNPLGAMRNDWARKPDTQGKSSRTGASMMTWCRLPQFDEVVVRLEVEPGQGPRPLARRSCRPTWGGRACGVT